MTPRDPRRRRRGVGLAIVLFAVLFFALIAAALVRRAAETRRVLRLEERQLQADWLAESGLERAAARLARDPGYEGETWRVDPVGPGPDAGEVRILVAPVAGRDDRRRVSVAADFPAGPDPSRRARREKSLEIPVPEPRDAPGEPAEER